MSEQLKEWAQLINDYFAAGLDGITAQRWGREIKSDCPNASSGDIINAIRAHKSDTMRRRLTVGDVIQWVRAAAPRKSDELKSCRLCNRGWIEYREGISDDFTLDDYSLVCPSTLPCLCTSGAYHLTAKYGEGSGSGLQATRQRASVQRQRYNKLIDEVELPEGDSGKITEGIRNLTTEVSK